MLKRNQASVDEKAKKKARLLNPYSNSDLSRSDFSPTEANQEPNSDFDSDSESTQPYEYEPETKYSEKYFFSIDLDHTTWILCPIEKLDDYKDYLPQKSPEENTLFNNTLKIFPADADKVYKNNVLLILFPDAWQANLQYIAKHHRFIFITSGSWYNALVNHLLDEYSIIYDTSKLGEKANRFLLFNRIRRDKSKAYKKFIIELIIQAKVLAGDTTVFTADEIAAYKESKTSQIFFILDRYYHELGVRIDPKETYLVDNDHNELDHAIEARINTIFASELPDVGGYEYKHAEDIYDNPHYWNEKLLLSMTEFHITLAKASGLFDKVELYLEGEMESLLDDDIPQIKTFANWYKNYYLQIKKMVDEKDMDYPDAELFKVDDLIWDETLPTIETEVTNPATVGSSIFSSSPISESAEIITAEYLLHLKEYRYG